MDLFFDQITDDLLNVIYDDQELDVLLVQALNDFERKRRTLIPYIIPNMSDETMR